MSTRASTNLKYIESQDSSLAFESPIVDLTMPQAAINYQLAWDVGVKGKFTWEAAIFPDRWETLVSCEEVTHTIDGSEIKPHAIVSLPKNWLNSERIRFIWTPDVASVGNIDVAIRIVPI